MELNLGADGAHRLPVLPVTFHKRAVSAGARALPTPQGRAGLMVGGASLPVAPKPATSSAPGDGDPTEKSSHSTGGEMKTE